LEETAKNMSQALQKYREFAESKKVKDLLRDRLI
jgi:hypothetical protein